MDELPQTHEPHGHGSHSHGSHSHAHGVSPRRLIAAATANSGFAVVQVLVGISLGSVVVLADAAHQVVDAIGLLTALAAVLLAARPTSEAMSFGWGKSDALGGLVSGLLLLGSIGWIVLESFRRLLDPVEVDGTGVIVIGMIAVAVNGLSVLALSGGGHASLSLRAARLHLITDLAGSFIVILAGVALAGTTATWIDPAASLLLSAIVLRATLMLVRNACQELLDRTPDGLSVDAVAAVLRDQPGVELVHHVHVRPLGQQRSSVTAHVVMSGAPTLHDAQGELANLNAALSAELGVNHSTLQLECHPCADEGC